jgi:hypothetical protein
MEKGKIITLIIVCGKIKIMKKGRELISRPFSLFG